MACERYHETLIEVALGVRQLHAERELSAHLEYCADCRRDLDAQRRLAAAIDLGVAASVAAEPSPEFVARIRQRIASEPAPAPAWWLGIRATWMPLTVGALAVVMLAFWLARRQSESPLHSAPEIAHVQRPSSGTQATPPANSNAASPPPTNSSATSLDVKRAPRGTRRVQIVRTTEPEVLVPPGEREAVLKFYAMVRSGRTDASALVAPASDTLEIKELKIAPLAVPALEPGNIPGNPDTHDPPAIERPDSPRRL